MRLGKEKEQCRTREYEKWAVKWFDETTSEMKLTCDLLNEEPILDTLQAFTLFAKEHQTSQRICSSSENWINTQMQIFYNLDNETCPWIW